MRYKPCNNIRTNRLFSGLSQPELGYLLGTSSGVKVSRYECATRRPNMDDGLLLSLIFDVDLRLLLAPRCAKHRKIIIKRALCLQRVLRKKKQDARTSQAIESLENLIMRLQDECEQ